MKKKIRWTRKYGRVYLDIDDLIEWTTTEGFDKATSFEKRAFLEDIKVRMKNERKLD